MADHSAACSSWSELPWDLLDRIMQHLELPEALAVASVCAPWRSGAAASGVPRSGTPWLVLQPGVLSPREKTATGETPHSQFRNLLGTNKKYTVSLSSQGRSHLAWCGASHGWLIASEEKLPSCSNLLLYNPFTFAAIPLPPITDLGGAITTVYHDDGVNIIGYHYEEYDEILARLPLKFTSKFFDKVVLSCDPSRGAADCIAMAIYGLNQVSFARPGDSSWRLAPIAQMGTDTYADCIYHNGRFYAVTMDGTVETWDLGMGPAQDPKKHVLIDTEPGIKKDMGIHDRFLVSTPWGALLQIRVLLHNLIKFRNRRMNVEVLQVDVEKHKLVKLSPSTAFREHAVFVGLNESACLHPKDFPELRSNCVYFTTPMVTHKEEDWSCIFHLESQTFEHVLTRTMRTILCPREVWFIPNI